MKYDLSQDDTCLILSLRHLGDAVVVAGFINALSDRYKSIAIDVLGRQDLREVTEAFCSVREYIPIELPLFGHHRKSLAGLRDAVWKIALLRKRKYDCCINLMGDVRENALGNVVGATKVISPVWPRTHPFRRHITTVNSSGNPSDRAELPCIAIGYYAAIESFAEQLGLRSLRWPKSIRTPRTQGDFAVVGLHPGASHPSKQWPVDKWRELIWRLAARGCRMVIYGSPAEADGLRTGFAAEISDFAIEIITSGMSPFLQSLATLDLLVCVDSFSSHAAHAVGLPTVVLHGPFDPSVMTPPSGVPLSAGDMCGMFPCYNGQSCANKRCEYICVRGIQVEAVMTAVDLVITRSPHFARG